MVALAINACLTAFHPDSKVSADWPLWAMISGILILAAPYEIYAIFPINDRAKELRRQIEKDRQPLTPSQETEIQSLLSKWAFRNLGRAFLPLVAGLLGVCNL